jgi:hypothetical protein
VAEKAKDFYSRIRTYTFQQVLLPKLDVLFVIDDNKSLSDNSVNVSKSMKSFMFHLLSFSGVDYQLARIDNSRSIGSSPTFIHTPLNIISDTGLTAKNKIEQKLSVQTSAMLLKNSIFDALYGFLKSKSMVSVRNNFFRNDAVLLLFLISDRTVTPKRKIVEYVNLLRVLKKKGKVPNIYLYTFSGGKLGCSSIQGKATASTYIMDISNDFASENMSICKRIKYLSNLQSKPVRGFFRRFNLASKPEINSLKVSINGKILSRLSQQGKENWKYHLNQNQLELFVDTFPRDIIKAVFIEKSPL